MHDVKPSPIRRLLVFGDTYGVAQALAALPADHVVAIVCADIRPQYHEALAALAGQVGVPLLVQPRRDSPRYREFLASLGALSPQGLLCHSYSMLLPGEVLAQVDGRAFNVHMALLPRHRGPNPVQWALIHGDEATGVSLHLMSEAFDTGAVVDVVPVEVLPEDNWVSLLSKLKMAAQTLLDRAAPLLLAGNWSARAQDDSAALSNPRIPSESFEIRFSAMTDLQVYNLIRAQVAPLKGAFLRARGQTIRFPDLISFEEVARLRKLYA